MNAFDFCRLNEYQLVRALKEALRGRDAYVVVPHPSGSSFIGHMLFDDRAKDMCADIVKKGAAFARGAAFVVVVRAKDESKEERKRYEEDSSDAEFAPGDQRVEPAEISLPWHMFRGPFPQDFKVTCEQGEDSNDIAVLRVAAQPGFAHTDPTDNGDERPQKRKRELVSAPQQKPSVRVHRLPLYDFHMDDIAARHKTMEARVFDGIFSKMRVGDVIQFFNKRRRHPVLARVTQATRYNSFQEMFVAEGIAPFMPRKATLPVQLAVNEYLSFPKYREKESTCGVVALQIDVNIDQDRRNY